MKYYPILAIDPQGGEVSLEIPLDYSSPELMKALTWYFENGWILKGVTK